MDNDIEIEVYRITPQNTVGVLQACATHRPTGIRGIATGSGSSSELERQALADLARKRGTHEDVEVDL
jgi:hypothetical protein